MSEQRRTAVIINPISGTGGRPDAARQRAERAAALLAARGVDAEIFVTERGGHARDLAAAMITRGVSLIVAWGGDGTVNEVASALAFTRRARLAVIPSGSGNGLARELGIPLDPAAAFACAVDGQTRVIDCGELDGRLFFNVAGLGLDARVAHEFAAHGLVRRGFARYLEVAARELFTYEPHDHTIVADGQRAAQSRAHRGARQRAAIRQRRVDRAARAHRRRQAGCRGRRCASAVEDAAAGAEAVQRHSSGPLLASPCGPPPPSRSPRRRPCCITSMVSRSLAGPRWSRVLMRRRCTCRCRPFDESLDSPRMGSSDPAK